MTKSAIDEEKFKALWKILIRHMGDIDSIHNFGVEFMRNSYQRLSDDGGSIINVPGDVIDININCTTEKDNLPDDEDLSEKLENIKNLLENDNNEN